MGAVPFLKPHLSEISPTLTKMTFAPLISQLKHVLSNFRKGFTFFYLFQQIFSSPAVLKIFAIVLSNSRGGSYLLYSFGQTLPRLQC